jgi:hypothetical protein
VRASAEAIRQRLQNTFVSAIKIGQELLVVKETLEHGQFLPWLQAEFGWSQRTAYNFMSVAERFELARIASLQIPPRLRTSWPVHRCPTRPARSQSKKAEAGEEITTAVAKEIVAEAKKTEKTYARCIGRAVFFHHSGLDTNDGSRL